MDQVKRLKAKERTPRPPLSAEQLDMRVRLAANLYAYRHEKGVSQEALAAAAGMHRVWPSRIERRLASPTFDSIVLCAKALGITVEALIADSPEARKLHAKLIAAEKKTNADLD